MNAIEITAPGLPEVLQPTTRPDPAIGPGEALVKVSASGVNRPDVLQRKGNYPVPAGASDIPGLEIAGTILDGDAADLAAAGFMIGDRVCALVVAGGYADRCAVPLAQCLPIPKGWTDIEAASLPETCFTVWGNVFERARLQPGESILIQGGTSGIGVTAIQLAKAAGAGLVIATAGSDEKVAACKALGADHAINYRTQDFAAEVLALTNKRGVDVVLDIVAGDYMQREISCLAEDGRIALVAVQGGRESTIDVSAVLRRRLTITGSTLRPRSKEFKASLAKSLREVVWPWIEAGKVKPVVYRTFKAAEAAQAHALMESNQHIGKLVLTW